MKHIAETQKELWKENYLDTDEMTLENGIFKNTLYVHRIKN